MTREHKQKIFEPLARSFETEAFKLYFLDMVAEIPDYIFTMPSSTSGKYHNKTQCQPYGQVYHIYMFDAILNHRLRLKGNKELYPTPEERDAMRCVPVFHDAIKCGWNGSKFTVADHPLLASKWVLETKVEHDVPMDYKQMIADMCESHSGEWNKNRSGQVIMSEPRNHREFFIHECDILASRVDLDYLIPDELKEVLNDKVEEMPDINSYAFTFGKYKGQLITDVAKEHKDYLEWMRANMSMKEPLNTFVNQLLA